MKMIVAIIQPGSLPDVKESLLAAGVHRMTVSNVIGAGQQGGYTETYRGAVVEVNLIKKVRLEIAVNEGFVDSTIDAIISAARHGEDGQIGDGKIFVMDLPRCIRIRTGEEGPDAIG